jgi:hypothetical protein
LPVGFAEADFFAIVFLATGFFAATLGFVFPIAGDGAIAFL